MRAWLEMISQEWAKRKPFNKKRHHWCCLPKFVKCSSNLHEIKRRQSFKHVPINEEIGLIESRRRWIRLLTDGNGNSQERIYTPSARQYRPSPDCTYMDQASWRNFLSFNRCVRNFNLLLYKSRMNWLGFIRNFFLFFCFFTFLRLSRIFLKAETSDCLVWGASVTDGRLMCLSDRFLQYQHDRAVTLCNTGDTLIGIWSVGK